MSSVHENQRTCRTFRWLGPNVWWEISQIWIEHIKPIGQMSDRPWTFFGYTGFLVILIPHGNINLVQHWLKQWLVARWYQAITWTNVDNDNQKCSVAFIWEHFHKKYSWLSHELDDLNPIIWLEIIHLKSLQHLPGLNELNTTCICRVVDIMIQREIGWPLPHREQIIPGKLSKISFLVIPCLLASIGHQVR